MATFRRTKYVARNSADPISNAFQLVTQGLAQLQEALRLQQQEADRKVQEALRLQEQRAANEMREMERKLREKDDTIRVLQQRFQETEYRVMAVEERTTDLEGHRGETGLKILEGRVEKVEASLQSAMQKFLPRVDSVLRQLDESQPTSASAPLGTDPSSAAAGPRAAPASGTEEARAAGGGENPPRSEAFSSSTSSDADQQGAAAGEEERERQRVKLRVREVEFKMEQARNSPSSLGEKLQEAATNGDLSEVRRLIDSGADVNYPDKFGCTPLHRAVYLEAHVGVVSLLLQRGADAKAVSSSGNSVLHWVATKDPSGLCVNLLVNAGADINARNLDGVTPLLRAAGEGNEKAVRALLSAGARKDLKPWGGRWRNKTPFEVATSPELRDLLRL